MSDRWMPAALGDALWEAMYAPCEMCPEELEAYCTSRDSVATPPCEAFVWLLDELNEMAEKKEKE